MVERRIEVGKIREHPVPDYPAQENPPPEGPQVEALGIPLADPPLPLAKAERIRRLLALRQ